MSFLTGILAAIISAASLALVYAVTFTIGSYLDSRRTPKPEPPAPPTLREVHQADMDHWDGRYQQTLMQGLGDECCLCDLPSGKYSCLIHREPRNHPPLDYIRKRAAEYRDKQKVLR